METRAIGMNYNQRNYNQEITKPNFGMKRYATEEALKNAQHIEKTLFTTLKNWVTGFYYSDTKSYNALKKSLEKAGVDEPTSDLFVPSEKEMDAFINEPNPDKKIEDMLKLLLNPEK